MSAEHPAHLRPVPAMTVVTTGADQTPRPPGLTASSGAGNTAMFTTDVLVALGIITRERVEEAIRVSRENGESPEAVLLDSGAINTDQLTRAVAERYGLDHVDLGTYHVDMGAANLLSPVAARRYRAVPIGFTDPQTLLLAMADPANVIASDDIQMITGLGCRVAVASEEDIDALIGRLSSFDDAVSEAIAHDDEEDDDLLGISEIRESADEAPVIKLVYSILAQAVNERASDIHFEPGERELMVRFRIDGVMTEAARVPRRMAAGVISRIKIMSELDIAEKRVPQDGRIGVTVEERKIDLRVTTLPTQRGEGATVRILDKERALMTLDDLGMSGEPLARYETAFTQPHGAILVTGPTGSGKSTTLYATLAALNAVEKKIITIEDPVEYRLDGVTQMNVNRRAGLNFANGLRSILRADPDIIMVGEIRDAETARIAVEAALTGHLVLTTLHTNDAPGAVTRLQKMGIESFLTASAIDCVIAQRLARKLCQHCKRPVVVPRQALVEAGFSVGSDLEAHEPAGCARCGSSGYRGRVALFSVMPMSDRIKDLAVGGAPEQEITKLAREEGMLTLREDGLNKVRVGMTSIEEVARVSR